MNSKVKIKSDEVGNIIVQSKNNPEYGHIAVEQDRIVVDDRGFARKKTINALIQGKVEDLKSFGWTKSTELAGKVVIRESLEPFNAKEPERDYKIAGKTGIVCCQDGQPIYRKHLFTFNMNEQDELVAHTNVEDIKAAYQQSLVDRALESVDDESSLSTL